MMMFLHVRGFPFFNFRQRDNEQLLYAMSRAGDIAENRDSGNE